MSRRGMLMISRFKDHPAATVVGSVALIGLLLTGTWGLRGRGLRGRALAVLRSPSISTDGEFTNVIFLHHSTGRNLIVQGNVRCQLAERGYQFWDHDYNELGVTRPDGSAAGFHYGVPDDNTNPDGLARIFAQPALGLPANTLGGLLQHEVIVFKSCFPVSQIASDEQLESYTEHYLQIRDTMDRHLDRVFIVVTPPPLNPAATDPEAASRARAFADWLTSDAYLNNHPNVFAFDLFDLLAEDESEVPDHNMLRRDYRSGSDSHPNKRANETIGPLLVDVIVHATASYRDGHGSGN